MTYDMNDLSVFATKVFSVGDLVRVNDTMISHINVLFQRHEIDKQEKTKTFKVIDVCYTDDGNAYGDFQYVQLENLNISWVSSSLFEKVES